ncbi:MAG: HAD family phosphatase [Oscillospiraceae bacterium]|nr:HAD family phosphatase [Oscillospiraceae bacterium]
MDKRFAIFDMDGTLVDSMVFWKNLAPEYLSSKGIAHLPEDILERIKPMTMSESAALFKQEFGLTGDPEAEMNAMMDEHYRNDIPLKPGVWEYLDQLHSRGVRMCVASATAEHLMTACLRRLGVLDYFEFLLSCETVGVGKRAPIVYHESARRLGAAPSDIAVYEDALYALKTAKDAGYFVVGVYDDSAKSGWQAIANIADETFFSWEEAL